MTATKAPSTKSTMASSSALFTPLPLGKDLTLSHRIAMPPLTRYRATKSHVPSPMMTEYYSQRASIPGSLLITEGTFISPSAGGFAHVPGIWSSEQISAWRQVVGAVHEKGSFIYLQLWALGRGGDVKVMEDEFGVEEGHAKILAPSAIKMPGIGGQGREGVIPGEMTKGEIQEKVEEYATAARNAVQEAGFDGVEIHGANGYLIDQFVQDVSNTRGDEYGGSIENRGRFALEVVKAVGEAVGFERVGIRFSPWSEYQGMKMDSVTKVEETFGYLVKEVKKLGVGYLHLVRPFVMGTSRDVEVSEEKKKREKEKERETLDFAIREWGKNRPVIIAGGLTPETARQVVEEEYPGYQIVVAFGRHFISTPDLVFRVREGLELNEYDRSTFYTFESETGYLDQPFSREFEEVYGPQGKGGLN